MASSDLPSRQRREPPEPQTWRTRSNGGSATTVPSTAASRSCAAFRILKSTALGSAPEGFLAAFAFDKDFRILLGSTMSEMVSHQRPE